MTMSPVLFIINDVRRYHVSNIALE